MPEAKPKLDTPEIEELKNRALDFIRRYSSDGEQLRRNRELALQAYRRDPYDEDARIPEGSRSKFVMSDVFDTVEAIKPSLMRIFYAGKDVVKIEGQGPEDEEGAELLGKKVNFDITRQNNGFLLFMDWFTSALLNKACFVKYWWESKDEYSDESFDDVTESEAAVLANDPDFIIETVKEREMEMDPAMMGAPPERMFKIEGRRVTRRVRRPVGELVPPEELVFNLKMRDIKTEDFVAHKKRIHKIDLMREYNLKEDDLEMETLLFNSTDEEHYERFKDLGGVGFFQDQDDTDFYYIYECCMKQDDKDRRKPIILTVMGTRVIRKEDNTYKRPNYCMLSPIRVPHRAIGMSIYDLMCDLQKLRSSIMRYIANNIYYQTENMMIVNPFAVNINDFVTQSRPGGKVRMKEDRNPNEAIMPIQPQPLAGHAYGLLDTLDSLGQKRSGVTSYNQGLDADSLNKTARGISEIMAAAQQRVELIARIFAETGVRDLMTAFAEMNIEFLDVPTNIRLDQRWQMVDPKAIDVLFDVTVDVALGTGSREVTVQQLSGLIDKALNPSMIATGIIQPPNLYEMWRTMLTEMGYKNTDKYLTDPKVLMQQQALMAGGMDGSQGAMGPNAGIPQLAAAGVPDGPATVQ